MLSLADWIHKNLPYDQLILEFYTPGEPNSGMDTLQRILKGTPRASYLHAFKSEGKTKYKPVIGGAKEFSLTIPQANTTQDLSIIQIL